MPAPSRSRSWPRSRPRTGSASFIANIKPGNILLAPDGAKVADFGIATIAEGSDLTTTGLLVGTTAYLPPERLAGEPASASSDLYGVGVVLFEALAGRPPFRADTPLALIAAISRGDAPGLAALRPDAPGELVAIAERAMATEPGDRFESATAMAAALRDARGRESRPRERGADRAARAGRGVERPAARRHRGGGGLRFGRTSGDTATTTAATTIRDRADRVVVALLLVIVVAATALVTEDDGGSGGAPPATSPATLAPSGPATASPIPQPLDRALDRLDRAVGGEGLRRGPRRRGPLPRRVRRRWSRGVRACSAAPPRAGDGRPDGRRGP